MQSLRRGAGCMQGGEAGFPGFHASQPCSATPHPHAGGLCPLLPLSSHPCLLLALAGHVALDLSLVHAIHGEPDQRAAQQEGPEGVTAPWVEVKAGGRG